MKRRSLLSALALVIGLTICNSNNVKKANNEINEETKVIKSEGKEANNRQTNEEIITMKDIYDYLLTKSAHYPLSDEFIEKYQQTSGGYLDYAKELGKIVDKERHEPDQKWHFIDSWLLRSIEDSSLTWNESAENRVYKKLLCPELLLWIYEACEVSPVKVRQAMTMAEQGKSAKQAVTTIAKNMRACVSWDDLRPAIENYKASHSGN